VLWRPNDGSSARIGFAIAKKNISLAVGRNRVRRLARESFRLQRTTLGNVDIVVLAQAAAGKATNGKLTASLTQHWDRIKKA